MIQNQNENSERKSGTELKLYPLLKDPLYTGSYANYIQCFSPRWCLAWFDAIKVLFDANVARKQSKLRVVFSLFLSDVLWLTWPLNQTHSSWGLKNILDLVDTVLYIYIYISSMEATYPLPTRTSRHCLSSFIFRTSFPWTVGDGFVFCEGYPTAALKEQHLIWVELNLIWGGRCGTFSIARLAGFCKGMSVVSCKAWLRPCLPTVAPSCPKKCCQS